MTQPKKRKRTDSPRTSRASIGSGSSRPASAKATNKRNGDKARRGTTAHASSKKPAAKAGAKQAGGKARKPLKAATSGSQKPAIGKPALWTKEPKGQGGRRKGSPSVVGVIGGAFKSVFSSLGSAIAFLLAKAFQLIRSSRVAAAIFAVVVLASLGWVVDTGVNWGKVYAGVSVGDVDLSGKTEDEARSLIEAVYAPRLNSKEIRIYANEEASGDYEAALAQTQNADAEEVSYEEAVASRVLWTTDAHVLQAKLNTDDLLKEAFAFGREEGGLIERIQALFGGFEIAPSAHYDVVQLEALAASIDETIGSPRVDFGITIADGIAAIVEGHDGYMVDRAMFTTELDSAFFETEGEYANMIAHADYAPLRIDAAEAQRARDLVNASIAPGAVFAYGPSTWHAQAPEIGSWVITSIVEQEGGYRLAVAFDHAKAKRALVDNLQTNLNDETLAVSFETRDGQPVVHVDTDEAIPLTENAIRQLEQKLFANGGKSDGEATAITVESGVVPETLSFDEALDEGIIDVIASYTTEYYAWPTERQHNIHLASDLLNNSLIKANGGTWSFNGTAGNCNEEAGFLASGAIINNEYTDDIGGGICQVATTIFNAVYDAGYPVISRFNHTLYIASYPAGRDAAVSWPDLDLKWENDGSSDALLVMSYTDTSITATLYGVSPGYQVSTTVGEWQEGEKHKTKTETDENLAPGTEYVKSVGTDGKKITVIRTVNDAHGNLLHADTFSSTYDPIAEVKVEGPKIEAKPEENSDGQTQREQEAKQDEGQ